jgi:hypothetical protein
MKINRSDLLWFLSNIRRRAENQELSDEQLVDRLAHYMEANPACVDMNGVSTKGRYSYVTIGYGVFSLFGEKYRMGRIEVHDRESDSGYAVHEGSYSLPHLTASQFEDFIESIETDLPINIEIGSHSWCEEECALSLGFKDSLEMRDPEKVKEYRDKKNDEYARSQGYEDWEDLLSKSKWIK